eukprot:198669_1
MSISAPKLNVSKTVIFGILRNNQTKFVICDGYVDVVNTGTCMSFDDRNFNFSHDTKLLNDIAFDIFVESNMIDLRVITARIIPMQYLNKNTKISIQVTPFELPIYAIALIILACIICVIGTCYGVYKHYLQRKYYQNAYVIDNALVFIIGISQFNDRSLFLKTVPQNVKDLVELWGEEYNYDVYVCKNDSLDATKNDVIDFIDVHKTKLQCSDYKCVIVHVISHGGEDSITCSDEKSLDLDFIRHELIEKAKELKLSQLVKLIFHHSCRGENDYHYDDTKKISRGGYQLVNRTEYSYSSTIDHAALDDIAFDSNLVTVSGNIAGRALSDYGYFTKFICDAFYDNLKRNWKSNWNTLIAEIGNNLEQQTNKAELCNVNGTLRFDNIRFERKKIKTKNTELELQRTDILSRHVYNEVTDMEAESKIDTGERLLQKDSE